MKRKRYIIKGLMLSNRIPGGSNAHGETVLRHLHVVNAWNSQSKSKLTANHKKYPLPDPTYTAVPSGFLHLPLWMHARIQIHLLVVKNPPAYAGDIRHVGLIPGLGRFPWMRACQPTLVFLIREFHGNRSLVGYSHGITQLDMTEVT